jgi:hypothetical protein
MLNAFAMTLCAIAVFLFGVVPLTLAISKEAAEEFEQISRDIKDENPTYWDLKASVVREGHGWLLTILVTNITGRNRFLQTGGSTVFLFDVLPTFAGQTCGAKHRSVP